MTEGRTVGVIMATFFLFQLFWIHTFFLSGSFGLLGINNDTRNGSMPVVLSDQASQDDDSEIGCINWEGKRVKHGELYVPHKSDMCTRCTCTGHFPISCHSVACSPPFDCNNVKLVSGACCEYECLDDVGKNVTDSGNPSSENTESITNLSLRLIASTVTSLLFLALLLFMVHRLRQRRMLMAMRRFQARSDVCISDDMDCDRNIPDNFLSLECPPYTDPPPPYSPPKPPHILPGEQPPAYDEISIAENIGRESRPGSCQEERNSHENRAITEILTSNSPSRPQLQHESNQSNSFQQMYSSQSPSFCVEVEMPRHFIQSRDATSHQDDDILPAYASTDVVFRNATFSTMVAPPHRVTEYNDTHSSNAGQDETHTRHSTATSNLTPTGMPTLTAFQKFSSLFKRDKSKCKDRSTTQPRRPVSEFVFPHYTTLSRTHHTLAVANSNDDQSNRAISNFSDVTYRHNNRSNASRVRSCYPNLSLTDRMRLSYDSARAAYELAALSPSTSSSSSVSVDQLPTQDGPITTSCVPPTATYSMDILSPSQSSTPHSQDCLHDLLQQQVENSPGSSCNESPFAQSSAHSMSSSSILCNSQCQTSGELNTASQFHSPPTTFKDNARHSPDRNASSLHTSDNSIVPSNQACSARYIDSEGRNYRNVTSSDGNRANRMRNVNPNVNNNPTKAPQESSKQDSPHATRGSPVNAGVFPPSPLPSLGQMRRSHSSTSQASAFSVCSETGEKKLKNSLHESNGIVEPLASDCQYPPHPHSLSQRHNNKHKSTPHSNSLVFRGHPSPPSPQRVNAPISATSTLVSDLQPATLVVPIVDHLLLNSNNPAPSLNKNFRQKDLNIELPAFGTDVSSSAVQCSPISPPFVTVQSGKLISNPPPPAPALEWPVGRDISDPLGKTFHDNSDESKKFRKRKEKDKRYANLSFKLKDTSNTPNHPHKDDKTKNDLGNVKNKNSRSSNSKSVANRRTDKKRLQHFQPSANVVDSSILPDFEDFSTPYGNADVYRSQVYEPPSSTSDFPVLSSPFHQYVDSPDNVQPLTDCGHDAKRSHTFSPPKASAPDFGAPGYGNNPPSSRRLTQQTSLGIVKYPSPQSRKKVGHKRQTSSGKGNSNHTHSPSQKHTRSKSLIATDRMQERCDPTANDAAFEQVVSGGRWVKSGFAQDLTFDNQVGGMDLGMSDRTLAPHYTHTNVPSFKANRGGESNGMSKSVEVPHHAHGPETKVATAAVVPLPSRRRSGLSQDLSFVNRSEANMNPSKRMSKRSSLPGFLTFTSQQPQKTYCDSSEYVVNENFHQQEAEMPQKQVKNSKERRDRSNSQDKNGRYTATSYV